MPVQEKSCEDELRMLMKEADVASDWRVDPVLKNACEEVVMAACDPSLGTDHVMVRYCSLWLSCSIEQKIFLLFK